MKSLVFPLGVLALLASSCSNTQGRTVSAGEQQAREIEARHTQVARLDPHTEVQVTQWNAQLRHAERMRAKGQPQAQRDVVDARVRRWDEAAKEVESYLVLLEIRDADAAQEDPRLDLASWKFQLRSGQGSPRKATRVELLSKDRFPASFGHAHWRMGARVDFPIGSAPGSVTLELWAPDESVPKHGLRANLPQLPARFEFAAAPRSAPRPAAPSLTENRATR